MWWRAARMMFVLFQVVWWNAIVPGHTRGVVVVPGYCCAGEGMEGGGGGRSCCEKKERRRGPDPGRAAHCAICSMAARVTPGVWVDFRLGEMGMVGYCQVETMEGAGVELLLTYQGRGPPGSA